MPAPPLRPSRGALIVGLPRSGTTLMRALLEGHPELLVVPREAAVDSWCHREDALGGLLGARESWTGIDWSAQTREHFCASLRELLPRPCDPATALEGVVEAVARACPQPGATRWVEKTPAHLRILPLLLDRLGPDTPVVCMLRDPRAVLSSRVRRWGRGHKRAVRNFVRKWASDDELVRRFEEDNPCFLLVRYEDLVSSPREVMERVRRHLDVSWHDTLLQPLRDGRPWGSRDRFTGVSTTSVERWRETLEPLQVAIVEGLLEPRLRARGYAVDGPVKAASRLKRAAFELRVRWALKRLRTEWAAARAGA